MSSLTISKLISTIMIVTTVGVGSYGRLHSFLWLDVLKDLESPLYFYQCAAQQEGSLADCYGNKI